MGPGHLEFLCVAASTLSAGACGDTGPADPENAHPAASSSAPPISKSDTPGGDGAARGCQVTLRSVMTLPPCPPHRSQARTPFASHRTGHSRRRGTARRAAISRR